MPIENYVYPEHYSNAVEDLSITDDAIRRSDGRLRRVPVPRRAVRPRGLPLGRRDGAPDLHELRQGAHPGRPLLRLHPGPRAGTPVVGRLGHLRRPGKTSGSTRASPATRRRSGSSTSAARASTTTTSRRTTTTATSTARSTTRTRRSTARSTTRARSTLHMLRRVLALEDGTRVPLPHTTRSAGRARGRTARPTPTTRPSRPSSRPSCEAALRREHGLVLPALDLR